MTKRNQLRDKLNAANRRRRRRGAAAADQGPPPANHTPSTDARGTDVGGLVVDAILRCHDGSHRDDDAIAVAALRAVKRGSPPGRPQALELYGQLNQIAGRPDVARRQFAGVVDDLLRQADPPNHRSHLENPFITYLSVLAS